MQRPLLEYDPLEHDKFHALTVRQPYAQDLVTPKTTAEDGTIYGVKSIEVRSKPTKYRGKLLICSSKTPVYPNYMSGSTLGFVELYDIKPVSEFTDEDWNKTRIPVADRSKIKRGYGWLMRNPRRVVEYPVHGQLGIYTVVYDKGEIIEYPTHIVYDEQAYNEVMYRLK